MSDRPLRILMAAALLTFAVTASVFAHAGEESSEISVEPGEVTAGGTVVLAGTGLEPNSERLINLVGPDDIVPFPSVTTDAEGMFNVTLTIPSHLPSGTYTLQAIADETMTVPLTITAAAGQVAGEPTDQALVEIVARNRSGADLAVLGLVVVLFAGLGLVLIARAERLGRWFAP